MANLAVVAIGGNSLIKSPERQSVPDQWEAMAETCAHIAAMIARGWDVVVTHGNGPQVGFILLRSELASHVLHTVPLDVCGADTQGAIGYMAQVGLDAAMARLRVARRTATVVTRVVVDRDDPAFKKPTKPIGPFFTKERAAELEETLGWTMAEDSGRGWRKLVASPRPRFIRGVDVVAALVNRGHIVIAAGGGGVPVVVSEDGDVRGVEAVIDKDYAASMLAAALSADLFIILTGVERVSKDFGKPTEEPLPEMDVATARRLLSEGQFPPGSMGPKIDAAVRFIEAGGKEVLIARAESLEPSLEGKTGTLIRRGTS